MMNGTVPDTPTRPNARERFESRRRHKHAQRTHRRSARQAVLLWLVLVLAAAMVLQAAATTAAPRRAEIPPALQLVHPDTQHPAMPQPALLRDTPAWYAPNGDAYGTLPAGERTTLLARYGTYWVQAVFHEHGELWVKARDLPNFDLATLPEARPGVVGYAAHVVQPTDDLYSVARAGGSDAGLLEVYNHLVPDSTLAAGQPLIVPRLAGHTSQYGSEVFLVQLGNPAQPRAALTIDVEMGDDSMRRLLAVLREHDVQATLFVVGAWADEHPDIVRQIIVDGHELGNHSYSHPKFPRLSDQQMLAELAHTEAAVQAAGGTTRPYFRMPYGEYDNRVLARAIEQGYLPVFWTIDSRDALGHTKSGEELTSIIIGQRTAAEMQGQVILTHCCIRESVTAAIPLLKAEFAAMGVELTTLSATLGGAAPTAAPAADPPVTPTADPAGDV